MYPTISLAAPRLATLILLDSCESNPKFPVCGVCILAPAGHQENKPASKYIYTDPSSTIDDQNKRDCV